MHAVVKLSVLLSLLSTMSPKGLVTLFLVGVCATQMVSANYRESRQVQALLDSAQSQLTKMMGSSEDAVRSSVETVMAFIGKMEDQVLEAASGKCAAMGLPIDLRVVYELFKGNANECVTNEAVKTQATAVMTEMSSCISKDSESLKGLIKDMQGLWDTCKTLPESMKAVAKQCSEHGEEDIPADVLNDLPAPPMDESKHDLAPVANDIMEEASHTMNKRWLWGFSRITRCVKSVYSLTKNDLVTIPGQIMATASKAYAVMKASSGNTMECVQDKTTTVMPLIKAVAGQVGSCMSKLDLDAIMEANPKLKGLKQMVEVANTLNSLPTGALSAASGLVGSLGNLAGGAGGLSGIVANVQQGGLAGIAANVQEGGLAAGAAAAANVLPATRR